MTKFCHNVPVEFCVFRFLPLFPFVLDTQNLSHVSASLAIPQSPRA